MTNKSYNTPLNEEEFEDWFQNTDLGELIPQEGGIVINRSKSKIHIANNVQNDSSKSKTFVGSMSGTVLLFSIGKLEPSEDLWNVFFEEE